MNYLEKYSLTELKTAQETIEKKMVIEENSLGEAKKYCLRDNKLWAVDGLKEVKVEELINEKTGNKLYDEQQIENMKLQLRKYYMINKRRNEIIIERLRREWGEEYFNDDEENKEMDINK